MTAAAAGAGVGVGVAACSELEPLAPPPESTGQRAVVIDTDMGGDDLMAILFLLQRPDISVEAITVTGTGLAHCAPGVDLALRVLALADRDDIPVACGREAPLAGDHAFPDEWRQFADEGSGATLPEAMSAPSSLSAPALLAATLDAHPGAAIVALGPLTNVAEALQADPALADAIGTVHFMGGAVDVPGNITDAAGNPVSDAAEWNLYADPRAAAVVLAAAPVTLVPLDATNQALITPAFLGRLEADRATPHAQVVHEVLAGSAASIEAGAYFFWDPLAAVSLVEEGVVSFEARRVEVVEEGAEIGRIQASEAGAEIQVGVGADLARFEAAFLDTLNGRAR